MSLQFSMTQMLLKESYLLPQYKIPIKTNLVMTG